MVCSVSSSILPLGAVSALTSTWLRPLHQVERPELMRVASQLLVRADLSDVAIDQHYNHVGLADRIVAMRGEQDDLLFGKGMPRRARRVREQ